MSRWTIAYRASLVILLAIIALELGGWRAIKETTRDVARAVPRPGLKEEAPAPPATGTPGGGIDRFYQKEIDASLDAQMRLERATRASAPR